MEGNLREQGFRLLIAYGRVYNDVITFLPVHRSCDTVLVPKLKSCTLKSVFVYQITRSHLHTVDDPNETSELEKIVE